MVENANESKNVLTEPLDIRKFIGVASITVLAINPNNNKLRSYGWTIPDNADEPKYVTVNEQGEKSARVRFLVQIQDLEDKPIIPLDFWIRPELELNKEKTKCRIIDSYGRTAWATKSDIQTHSIPTYANGPANVSKDFKACHQGEENLVLFLMKYLNMTPLEIMNNGKWVVASKPGRLTIDDWNALCRGDVSEIASYVATKEDNRCKVALGLSVNDENRTFQTFLPKCFLSNGTRPDMTGNYTKVSKAIDEFIAHHSRTYLFEAGTVHEYRETPTEVLESGVIPGTVVEPEPMPLSYPEDLPM